MSKLKRRKSKPKDNKSQSQNLKNNLNNSDTLTCVQGHSTLICMVVTNHHNISIDFNITNLLSLCHKMGESQTR